MPYLDSSDGLHSDGTSTVNGLPPHPGMAKTNKRRYNHRYFIVKLLSHRQAYPDSLRYRPGLRDWGKIANTVQRPFWLWDHCPVCNGVTPAPYNRPRIVAPIQRRAGTPFRPYPRPVALRVGR